MNSFAILADAADSPRWLELITRPEVMVFAVPIVAIVCGIGYKTVTAIIRHRERMAKIEHGIDPDARDTPR
ncbi:MAG TPA: hypothetical protein VG056_08145 [Pirellulales bacterium]|jgi:hypothetical protein|nr:hypothetical protein [Pirellulales bacterium]